MEVKISKTSRACFGCQRVFIHDEELRSLVRVTDGSLNREDYCAACWTEEKAAGAYSQWSLHFYDPKVAEQEPPEVFSPLRRLFYEAAEQEDRIDQAKAFLAAQLLRRQKVFRLVKEADEDEGEARLYLFADRIGNRLIEVRDPRFSYPEMEAGRRRLMERLEQLEHPETGNDNGHDTPTE